MRMLRGLPSSTAVAILLVFGPNTSPAQSLVAASGPSNHSENRPEFRAVTLAKSPDGLANPFASAFNAPLPPPPQLSRKKAIVLGVVIGGVVGATAGYFIAHDSCNSCDDSGSLVAASSLGAVAGATLGGFVAAQNSPPDVSRSALRAGPALLTQRPHPIVQYHATLFR
ncbi:MAG: hypothetical protein ABJB74_14110 [Gemmatimonas sp.]